MIPKNMEADDETLHGKGNIQEKIMIMSIILHSSYNLNLMKSIIHV